MPSDKLTTEETKIVEGFLARSPHVENRPGATVAVWRSPYGYFVPMRSKGELFVADDAFSFCEGRQDRIEQTIRFLIEAYINGRHHPENYRTALCPECGDHLYGPSTAVRYVTCVTHAYEAEEVLSAQHSPSENDKVALADIRAFLASELIA